MSKTSAYHTERHAPKLDASFHLAERLKGHYGDVYTQQIKNDGYIHTIAVKPGLALSGKVVNPAEGTVQELVAILSSPSYDLYGIVSATEESGGQPQRTGYFVSRFPYGDSGRAKLIGALEPDPQLPCTIAIPPESKAVYPGQDWRIVLYHDGAEGTLEIQQIGPGMTEVYTPTSDALMQNPLPKELWAPPSAEVRAALGGHALANA